MKWGADSLGVWTAAWGCRFSLHRMRSVHAGLRFFSLGVAGEEEWGEKGWQVSRKGPTSLLDSLTPRPVSSHETPPGPELETSMAAGRRVSNGTKSMVAFVRLGQGPSVD